VLARDPGAGHIRVRRLRWTARGGRRGAMRTLPDSSAVVPIASGRRAVSRQRAFDSPRVQVPRRRL